MVKLKEPDIRGDAVLAKPKATSMKREGKMLRSQQKDATHEQILEAATALLAEQGYAALRVASVAKRAGVSLGGQLHHFPSKDSLVVAVLERVSAHVMTLAMQEAARATMDDDPLTPISRSAERFYSAPEFLIYLDIFLSVRRQTPIGDTAVRLLTSQRAATEAVWIPHLTSRGIDVTNATLIVRSLWGLSRGLAISSMDFDKSCHQETLDLVLSSLKMRHFDARD
jgi:AcrR family transcriptional regulator